MYSLIGTTEWIRVTAPWTGGQDQVVLFPSIIRLLMLVRLNGFELLTLGPGDQEQVVLFPSDVLLFIYLFYLNVGTTEWIRTADLWTG